MEEKDRQNHKIHIAVENFGPIEKAEIDLRPLSVFVGESNTGKTYLASLIYALFHTFEGFAQVPLPHSIITLLKQSRFRSQNEQDKETLETLNKLNTLGRTFKYSDFPKWLCTHINYYLNDSEYIGNELKRCFNLNSVSDLIRFTAGKGNEMKVSLKVCEEKQSLWDFEMKDFDSDITVDGDVNADMILCIKGETASQKILDLEDLEALLHVNGAEGSDCYYLPAPRGGIMETHGLILGSLVDRTTRIGSGYSFATPMLNGKISDLLKHMINYTEYDKSSGELLDIAKTLENEVLRGVIEVTRPAGIGFPQFRYRPQNAEQTLDMSRSSSMVPELVLLVLFLRGIVKQGDTLIIDEPEAHLHPKAQTQIAITLARLVRAGVRVITTTHSDWLLEQIGNLVREGEVMKLDKDFIDPPTTWLTEEEVGAWRFHADRPVEEIGFDLITGFEPQDYGEVAEELYNRAVDLRTLLMKKMGDGKIE